MTTYTEKELESAFAEVRKLSETIVLPVKEWDVEAVIKLIKGFLNLKK